MTAPVITSINIPPQQISYPGKVKITVVWDQPIYNLDAKVTFECKTRYKLWEQNNNDFQTNPPVAVGIAQTDCVGYQSQIKEVTFEFQVSPFGDGPLILSSQPWIPPAVLNVENAWGEKGNWAAFLTPGVFEPIVINPYFSWVSQTSPQILNEWVNGMPKMRKSALCPYSPAGGARPTVSLKFGPSPNYPETDLPSNFWEGGVFWWWYNIGSTRATQLTSSTYYRAVGNAVNGPGYYAYSQLGMGIDTTSPPDPFVDGPNPYGQDIWLNYNNSVPASQVYSTCPWMVAFFPPDPDPNRQPMKYFGRLESWICSGPENYSDFDANSWYNQQATSTNQYNLAPWRLAFGGDGLLRIQTYIFTPWVYNALSPPSL
jgi:hypothetical protein